MHVTESACEALGKLLGRAGPERCLRLNTSQGKYRFIVDEPIEHDILYHCDERVVLAVSDTVSHDLWGITVDCTVEAGKQKLIFRKAIAGEPLDSFRDDADVVPPQWRAGEHERLLGEIAEIGRQIQLLRGGSKSRTREKLHALEAQKHVKWDAIRALWAGDGGWHKLNGAANGVPANGVAASATAANGVAANGVAANAVPANGAARNRVAATSVAANGTVAKRVAATTRARALAD